MWSLVALITFIHVLVDCIAREPNQGESSSSRPQRHHWNPDTYHHDSLCCESQFSFKKQTPYVFKDSILLLLNPTLKYLNFHSISFGTPAALQQLSTWKYPSTHYQAEQQCDQGFRGFQVWTRKKLGISLEIDQRISTREEQCRCVFQMVMEE
jgi:hypothetical protein